MFRENSFPKDIITMNCLITGGGLGDLLGSLMAVNYIYNNAKWINLLVWVPDYMLEFAKHVLPSNMIIRNYSDAKTKYENKRKGITTQWKENHTPMRTHPVKYSFHMLADYSPTISEMEYLRINEKKINLSKFNLPEKYVVLQGAYTEKVKTMPPKTFNEVKNYVKEKGYEVILLGRTENKSGAGNIGVKAKVEEEFILDDCINLIDKTSLLESAAIIQKSKSLVAMDGGLVHLAGFTDAPIVAGYTFANYNHLSPIRNGDPNYKFYPVTPDESLGCKFCQSNWTLFIIKNHDFRNCYYGPNDFSCVKQMTSEKFISKLKTIL